MKKLLNFLAANTEIIALFALSHIVALIGFAVLMLFSKASLPVRTLLANAPIVYFLPNIISMLFFANLICSLNERVLKLRRLTMNLYFIFDAIVLAAVFTVLIVLLIVFLASNPEILKTAASVALFPLVMLALFSHGTAVFMLPGIFAFAIFVIGLLLALPFILYAEFALSYNIVFHHRKHKNVHKKRNRILLAIFVLYIVFSSLVPYTKNAREEKVKFEQEKIELIENLAFDIASYRKDGAELCAFIESLKNMGFDFNTVKNGKPYLCHLLENNMTPETIRLAIDSGADVNKSDEKGRNPIHYAFEGIWELDCVELLAENGAVPTVENLLLVFEHDKPEDDRLSPELPYIEYIVPLIKDWGWTDGHGNNALHFFYYYWGRTREDISVFYRKGVREKALKELDQNFSKAISKIEETGFDFAKKNDSGLLPKDCFSLGKKKRWNDMYKHFYKWY